MPEQLFRQERLRNILDLLQKQGRVSVGELGRHLGVSAVTIRNDLAVLERQGQLVRTHGGAVARAIGPEPAFALRQELHQIEKVRIGRAAAETIRDGEAVALDASTTAWQVARHLKDRCELTVVTNSLYIALELLDSPGVTVVMPGGILRAASVSLVGEPGVRTLDNYNVQKGFFGAQGLAFKEGLTDVNQHEVEFKRQMTGICREVNVVLDSSKWGRVAFASFASLDRVHRVISDPAAPPAMVEELRRRGIDVVLA